MDEKDLIIIIDLKRKAIDAQDYVLATILRNAQSELENKLHSNWTEEQINKLKDEIAKN